MRVLLIEPYDSGTYGRMKGLVEAPIPLGLLYIASSIRSKRKDKVGILDLKLEDKSYKELGIFKEKIDVFCFTAMSTMWPLANKIVAHIKKKNSSAITMIGGTHVSLAHFDELKKAKDFDYFIIGEGEETVVDLLNAIDKKKDLSNVKGIAYWDKNKLVKTEPREFIKNLDEIPFPAYDMINLKNYGHPVQIRKPLAVMLSSRGCPGLCTFCSKSAYGRFVRLRSAKNVVDEIEMLVKKYGAKEIRFVDQSFTISKKHVMDICNEIIKRKIKVAWICSLRADRNDLEMFKLMKKSGCYAVNIGAESGNQEMLNNIKKRITLDQIRDTVKRAHKAGLKITTYFIIGFPNETKKQIMDTINFANSISSDIVKFSIFTPFPGSEIYEDLEQENRLFHHDWDKYNFHNDPVYNLDNLSHKEVVNLYKKAYRKVYTNPKMILRTIKRLDSPTAIKNTFHVGFTMLRMFFRK